MAAVRYLRFWKFQFLTVWTVKWSILHNRAKFREDRSICCCDIAIFVVFQDGGRHHLGFWKILNFNGLSPVGGGAICVTVPKFIKIGLTVAEIWRINGFCKRRPSAILDLSGAYWDHPGRLLGSLYRLAEFGWNRCSTFDNMKVLTFCAFGLKTPIHAPNIGVWGGFDSLNREH